MARAKTNRQLRREDPPPKPIVLPAAADETDTPVAETRSAPAPQPKQKKSQGPSTAKTKRQRDKALKGAEFAAKLETKSSRREDRKAKKQTAKKLWE